MSLNKFMHPRNKYRKPPDFKALAVKYPEFRKYAKQDISGKVSLNFKDLEAVRALSCTLLKEDFGLDVEIPLNRLVPTLPLRLNYLLWIEDLLENNKRTSDVKGIDIGCGASCVYPLLAAKQFGWNMLATEVDTDSAFIASSNVKKNNFQDVIRVRTVNEGQMLEGVLEPKTVYDFCMCNPPFFSSTEELDPKNVSRSPNRPAPRNAHSGSPMELVAPGGEIAFVTQIIQDSVKLKGSIRIYSVMVGHKTSVAKVCQALKEAGVTSITTTEFCQGRTTRWGMAWALDPTVSFPQNNDVPLSHKKKTPFCYTFESDLASTVERLHKLLEELQITYTTLENNQELCGMEITALENTWANSRKKRRQEKLKQKMAEKCELNKGDNLEVQPKVNNETEENKLVGSGDCNSGTLIDQQNTTDETKTEEMKRDFASSISVRGSNELMMADLESKNVNSMDLKGSKRTLSESDDSAGSSNLGPVKRAKVENYKLSPNTVPKREPLLYGSLIVKKSVEGSVVELCWLRGSGGRDSAHQVLQYFKNNFKPH